MDTPGDCSVNTRDNIQTIWTHLEIVLSTQGIGYRPHGHTWGLFCQHKGQDIDHMDTPEDCSVNTRDRIQNIWTHLETVLSTQGTGYRPHGHTRGLFCQHKGQDTDHMDTPGDCSVNTRDRIQTTWTHLGTVLSTQGTGYRSYGHTWGLFCQHKGQDTEHMDTPGDCSINTRDRIQTTWTHLGTVLSTQGTGYRPHGHTWRLFCQHKGQDIDHMDTPGDCSVNTRDRIQTTWTHLGIVLSTQGTGYRTYGHTWGLFCQHRGQDTDHMDTPGDCSVNTRDRIRTTWTHLGTVLSTQGTGYRPHGHTWGMFCQHMGQDMDHMDTPGDCSVNSRDRIQTIWTHLGTVLSTQGTGYRPHGHTWGLFCQHMGQDMDHMDTPGDCSVNSKDRIQTIWTHLGTVLSTQWTGYRPHGHTWGLFCQHKSKGTNVFRIRAIYIKRQPGVNIFKVE